MTGRDDTADHVNFGMLTLREPKSDRRGPDAPTTVIVTGVGRSGTSMVASVLDALGIPMGKTDGLAVFEDQELLRALVAFNYEAMCTLIDSHNAKHLRWGFKFASLQNHIFPAQLSRFRNPYLIVVMRDPVATANRSYHSDPDKKNILDSLVNVTKQNSDMLDFVVNSNCPVLMISYEKSIVFPEVVINKIAEFCGIELTDSKKKLANLAISPNNSKYIKLFHPNHRGHLDVVKFGLALGWCAAMDNDEPVEVELLADGVVLGSAKADVFRADLLDAGIGNGCHAFQFDLTGFGLKHEVVLDARTTVGGYVLDGSGSTLKHLLGK